MKKRKLICKLLGCDSSPNWSCNNGIFNHIGFPYDSMFCSRCKVYFGSYNRSVIGIIKKAILDIKYLIND
jgi:hypothetical protein